MTFSEDQLSVKHKVYLKTSRIEKSEAMIMTVLLFVRHFFRRKDSYSTLFSSAISEGIKDLFKEMGYSSNEFNKKENVKKEMSFRRDKV